MRAPLRDTGLAEREFRLRSFQKIALPTVGLVSLLFGAGLFGPGMGRLLVPMLVIFIWL